LVYNRKQIGSNFLSFTSKLKENKVFPYIFFAIRSWEFPEKESPYLEEKGQMIDW
jgi:hypothetical protein